MLSQNPKSISNPRWNSVVIAPWPLLTWNIPSAFLQLSWHWHFCGQQARWFLECLSICLIFLNFEKALKGSYELPVSPAFSLSWDPHLLWLLSLSFSQDCFYSGHQWPSCHKIRWPVPSPLFNLLTLFYGVYLPPLGEWPTFLLGFFCGLPLALLPQVPVESVLLPLLFF